MTRSAGRGRLVMLVVQPPDGGVHRHVSELARGLARHGWEVVVAGPPSYAETNTGSIRHVRLDMARSIEPGADARALRRLGALVRAVRPTLVHAHSSKAGALARLAVPPVLGGRVVYSPHGFAHAGYFEARRARAVYRTVETTLGPATARVICACEAERAIAATIVGGRRTRVAHNGVELIGDGERDPTAVAAAGRGPVLSLIAGLRPGKGVETAVEALALVRRRHPAAQLVVAGDGPRRPALEALADRLGVAGAVHLPGTLPDPATVLRTAAVHVSASWAESFPFAVLEGMAAGLPVVATDVGGTREAVLEGVTGRLVPARDAGALAAAIGGLLDDPASRLAFGAAARERIATAFTPDGMVERVHDAYLELLADP